MFPGLEVEVLVAVLEACGGGLSQAVEQLAGIEDTGGVAEVLEQQEPDEECAPVSSTSSEEDVRLPTYEEVCPPKAPVPVDGGDLPSYREAAASRPSEWDEPRATSKKRRKWKKARWDKLTDKVSDDECSRLSHNI